MSDAGSVAMRGLIISLLLLPFDMTLTAHQGTGGLTLIGQILMAALALQVEGSHQRYRVRLSSHSVTLSTSLALVFIGIDAIFIIVMMARVAADIFRMQLVLKLDRGALMVLQLR